MNAHHRRILPDAFNRYQDAARALILSGAALTAKQGQFCGNLAFSEGDLTEKQERWLVGLLRQHGLPPLADGGGHG